MTLEQIDSGRVAWLRHERDGKRYLADSVPPGRYRAAAGTSALGFRSLGELEVVAGGLTDLGVATLAAPGKLQLALELAAEFEVGSFFLVRVGATNESAVILEHFSAPRSPIALPAGSYALRLLGQHGIHQSLPLRIASGETTMLSGDRTLDAR